jgi:hypothetical protein
MAIYALKCSECFLVLFIDKESPTEQISFWAIDRESMMRSYIVVSRDKSKRIDRIMSNCLKIQSVSSEFLFP